jgi:preprotein translocase subunit SecG
MGILGILLLALLVISAVLLVLVVLLQDDQGEGLGGIFGGGASTTAFGSRSGNVLTRFTAVLATVFLLCVVGVAYLNRSPTTGNVIGAARQEALQGKTPDWWAPTTAAPATPAPATTAPEVTAPEATAPAAPAGSSTGGGTTTAPAGGSSGGGG